MTEPPNERRSSYNVSKRMPSTAAGTKRSTSISSSSSNNQQRQVSFGSFLPQQFFGHHQSDDSRDSLNNNNNNNDEQDVKILLRDATPDEEQTLNKAEQLTKQYQSLLHNYSQSVKEVDVSQVADRQVVRALQNQQHLNEQMVRVTSTNYMVNVINYLNNRRLNQQVTAVSQDLARQTQRVEDLSVEVQVQRTITTRVDDALAATRQLLQSSIGEYRTEISRHNQMLSQQTQVIGKLYATRVNQDLLTDSLIFVASLYTVNSVLVKYPVRLLVQFLSQLFLRMRLFKHSNQQRQQFMQQIVRLVLLAWLMQRGKQQMVKYGVHNQVGGYVQYARDMAVQLTRQMRERVVGSTAAGVDEIVGTSRDGGK